MAVGRQQLTKYINDINELKRVRQLHDLSFRQALVAIILPSRRKFGVKYFHLSREFK